MISCSSKLRHRGPDWSGYKTYGNHAIAHERLAIIDPESGAQPLMSRDESIVVAVNGEIYNYKDVYAELETKYDPVTGSDCEVMIPLYQQLGIEKMAKKLRGMFAVVIYDKSDDSYCAVRDHLGKIPMYIGYGADGSVWFASELKAIAPECARFELFPPGHFYSSKTKKFESWYNPVWRAPGYKPSRAYDAKRLRLAFEKAVHRRMMSDVPWGVLLSGGLDSSLVASISMRKFKEAGGQKLHSFCIGLEGSPDLAAAQKVADYLGTTHHSFTYSIQEGIDAIREVIYHLETYDTTTVRAATPMYLMARKIKAMGIKMVLSGEGADEIFGGYLYFHKAPNPEEMHLELRDKLANLHLFDCLRANKSTSAWGVEARTPFLDADFLDEAMTLDASFKMIDKANGRIEKHILRQAFDTPEDPYLPSDILWRQKEQFSDGVGYGWIDSLRDNAALFVSDQMFAHAAHRYPVNTPPTKENYYYRSVFDDHFPQPSAALTVPGGPSIACSTSRAMEWDANFKKRVDCSGRSVSGVHDQAYDDTFELRATAEENQGTQGAKQ